jgi:hypothetical protein
MNSQQCDQKHDRIGNGSVGALFLPMVGADNDHRLKQTLWHSAEDRDKLAVLIEKPHPRYSNRIVGDGT